MVTFKSSLAKAQEIINPQQNNNVGTYIAAAAVPTIATVASAALSQIFSAMSNSDASYTPTKASTDNKSEDGTLAGSETDSQPGVSKNNDDVPVSLDAKKQEIVDIIKQNKPDFSVDNEFMDELVTKYDLYKTCHPEWADEYLAERLNMYLKALEGNKTMIKYGEISTQGEEAIQGMMNNMIDDAAITAGIAANNNGNISDEYLNSIENRGVGYLDLYDVDSNGVVSFEEFLAKEQKDAGRTLTDGEKIATREYFNIIDKNHSNGIDAKEMASHLYAVSRLYDFDSDGTKKSNTENDILFEEWYGAQSNNVGVRQRMQGLSDSFYSAIKNR